MTRRSQGPATFLAGDILAAATAHLLINLALGAIGGGLGALLAPCRRP